MTRFLSELLEAREPDFRRSIDALESANANPAQDIRLSQQLVQANRQKIAELGLDPEDTTGSELYHALIEKLKRDDRLLIRRLREISASKVSAAANITDGLAVALKELSGGSQVFALKTSVAKRILTKLPPKHTLKALGYRSNSSMLKHEPVALIVSMSEIVESDSWRKQYLNQIKSLKPSDFEQRKICVIVPNKPSLEPAFRSLAISSNQTALINSELMSIIILPVINNQPKSGLTTASLSLALEGLNTLYTASSYLRLSQFTKEFGHRLELVSNQEPQLGMSKINTPLSWETLERFVFRASGSIEYILETPVDIDVLFNWQPVESLLHKIEPKLNFWSDTGHLSVYDGKTPVSLNVMDNALNVVNRLPYGKHLRHHAQRALWQELMLRYIRPDLLKDAIEREMQPQLAAETVIE